MMAGQDAGGQNTYTMSCKNTNTLGAAASQELAGQGLSLDMVAAVAAGDTSVVMADDAALALRLAESHEVVSNAVERGDAIYGVTTGFGGMANEAIPCSLAIDLQNNLLNFLACGAGEPLDRRHVRAAILLRANVLLQGYSGVRQVVIERMLRLLQVDAIPVVRSLGSIGASGDLVPLAAIARAVVGNHKYVEIEMDGERLAGEQVLTRLGLSPIELLPKEGLALVNGTSFSAAIAANAVFESKLLMALTFGVQSLMLRALLAQEDPFQSFVHQRKPHAGQVWSAKMMRQLLGRGRKPVKSEREFASQVQDRYSLRCLPQYMGPIVDGMVRIHRVVQTEMNSVSDNPLVDPDADRLYQSGNFLGQYIAMAMDDLRRLMGLMAKHIDVQIATLVTSEFSGLPPSLRGNEKLPYNMGMKGLQIAGNSIMPMLTYHGNSLVDHFPTHAEQFNQNINGLSFGAANLAWTSVGLFQQYLAISLLFAVQALDLRARQLCDHYDGRVLLGSSAEPVYNAVCQVLDVEVSASSPFLLNDSDRWLERDIQSLVEDIKSGGLVIESIQPVLQSLEDDFRLAEVSDSGDVAETSDVE